MTSERLGALIDVVVTQRPIDRLIARLKDELSLGYYKDADGDDALRKALKWADKYKHGES